MSVSRKNHSSHPRIAQLEQEIAAKELEYRHLRLETILALDKAGNSLSIIGQKVGLTKGRVHQILAAYKATQNAGAN